MEGNSQDARTVREVLGRYEETLRGAVQEIHVDIQAFKADVLRTASPLARTVAELQQENQQLRARVERLAHQLDALCRQAGLEPDDVQPAPAATTQVSPAPSRALSPAAKLGATGGKRLPRVEIPLLGDALPRLKRGCFFFFFCRGGRTIPLHATAGVCT